MPRIGMSGILNGGIVPSGMPRNGVTGIPDIFFRCLVCTFFETKSSESPKICNSREREYADEIPEGAIQKIWYKINPKYKDRLFCKIFGREKHKDYAMALCDAV